MWDNNIIAYKRVPQNRPDVTLVLKDKQWYLGNGAGDVAAPDNRKAAMTAVWKIARFNF